MRLIWLVSIYFVGKVAWAKKTGKRTQKSMTEDWIAEQNPSGDFSCQHIYDMYNKYTKDGPSQEKACELYENILELTATFFANKCQETGPCPYRKFATDCDVDVKIVPAIFAFWDKDRNKCFDRLEWNKFLVDIGVIENGVLSPKDPIKYRFVECFYTNSGHHPWNDIEHEWRIQHGTQIWGKYDEYEMGCATEEKFLARNNYMTKICQVSKCN